MMSSIFCYEKGFKSIFSFMLPLKLTTLAIEIMDFSTVDFVQNL